MVSRFILTFSFGSENELPEPGETQKQPQKKRSGGTKAITPRKPGLAAKKEIDFDYELH